MLRYATILVLLTTACNPFGCDERKETVEVDTASVFYEISYGFVKTYRERGYDCNPTAISGTRTIYTCTKCD